MALQANNRNGGMLIGRNERTMPKWVSEQADRIGPRPPPPPLTPENGHVPKAQPNLPPKTKTVPEPDYEVIEFSNQQYSNTPLRPNSANSGSKTPDSKLKCTLCGSGNPWVTCEECAQQIFCASCDDMFHKHPKRKNHQRKTLEQSRPPLPPKVVPGQPGPAPPVAPPRRNKRGIMTPLMQRKDQGNSMPGPFPVPASPTPSMKNASWQERFGSLPRGLNILNRPLPETPKTPSESSRSTTPKSVFDNIQRPPSVALEKIKSKANATLDRMQILQQRYRQQKEQMERERSGSATDQNISAFDQWSNISQSPSHFRSGSMSSGINSSHLDLTDENNFNLFHQRQMAMQNHQMTAQRANQLGQRGMSSSVFNLNQMQRKQPQTNNEWMNNSMQQAQSMAQLNCANCNHSQQQQPHWVGPHQHIHMTPDPWSNQLSSQQHFNRSNLSLNVGAGYMMQSQHNGMYPPPVFMNQRGLMQQMYPAPYMGGMPVMNPGLMGMPPSTSRTASRAGSRMASPAMSRKSVTLRRKQRSGYMDDDATDDEDSDEDDRRSINSNRSGISRSRQRRMSSASQIQLDDDMDAKVHRNRVRGQRRDSIAKSVHNDWAPGRRGSTTNNNRSVDSGFNSPLKPSRIYSDLDSEGSGTRALVQAKIEQKLKEDSLKQKQTKSKRQSVSPTPQKQSAAVQTPAVKQSTVKQEKLETENKGKLMKESAKPEKEDSERESEEGEEEETEEETDEEVEESKTNTHTQENQVNEEPEIEEDDLGPPPSTPDHEWECEFCTFVNEANTKICAICCKTPCNKPKKAAKAISPPKQMKTPQTTKDKEKEKSGTIKKKSSTSSNTTTTMNTDSSKATSITNNVQSSKIFSSHNTDKTKDTATTDTLKKKESVEDIWATLDENIQATAHEVTLKAESKKPSKVSTACGTSSKSASVERQEVESRKSQAREIGTSPPPQNISTQTYDTLPIKKSEAREDPIIKPSQPIFNDIIQKTNFPSSPKIQDLKSFEAEVLNNIHNISHIPSTHHHYHQQQHHYPSYYPNERQRYRSNNDLRMDDAISADFDNFNGLGRRQPSINELMLLQRTSSQMHSPLGGSIYDLPYRELSSLRHNDMDNHKESDIYKHTTEELNAALKYCGPDMHPLVWLRDNWPKLIQTVQSLATKYGQERAENTIGTISQMEAREALRLHTGNIWQAVSECIEQRQRKYREISSKGNFSREDIVTALTTHHGNVELALMDLGRTQLKPFLMRIWGSPGGVENESGAVAITMQSSQSSQYNMDKDIHNFLSANASECMQIPNTIGAFQYQNQMPSPYDLPASLTNPYENNNHMPDNTSSYSADSKDYAPSPLQLDDSILGNKSVLKDLETLIGSMEQNQQKQNERVLRSIQDMIINSKQDKPDSEYDTETMRILTKSPINSPKTKNSPNDSVAENEADVKNFVWQHIQEIVPNLVQQVEMELMEDVIDQQQDKKDTKKNRQIECTPEPIKLVPPTPPPPPIDQDEFLMEEVIKPNLKNASFREELPPQYVYAAEIATFQMAFDKGLEREHEEEFEYDSLEEAERKVFKMFKASEPLPLSADNKQPIVEEEVSGLSGVAGINEEVLNTTLQEVPIQNTSTEMQSSNISQHVDAKTPVQPSTTTEVHISIVKLQNKITGDADIQTVTNTSDSPVISTENQPVTETEFEDLPKNDDSRVKSPENLQHQQTESNILKPINRNKSTSSIPVLGGRKTPLPETPNYSNTPEPQSLKTDTAYQEEYEKDVNNISSSSHKRKSNKEAMGSKSSSTELLQYKISTAKDLSEVISLTSMNSTESTSNLQESFANQAEQTSDGETTGVISQDVLSNNELIQHISSNSSDLQQSNNSTELTNELIPQDVTIASEYFQDLVTSEPVILETNSTNSGNAVIETEMDATSSTSANAFSSSQRKISKIPVRRTASNKSLPTASMALLKTEEKPKLTIQKTEENSQETFTANDINQQEIPDTSLNMDNINDHVLDDESEDEELYSIGSETSATQIASREDQFQSPTSTSEIFLTIQQEGAETITTIVPSSSSSTLHSVGSQSSGLKSPTEFIPSGDPSKQNLSDLVKDTQRLIKQMKDEISIDDFESSTDDDYTDEYTDEYDDDEGGEEEEDDEDWEEEEEGNEDYDDISEEDLTEENDTYSGEVDHISNTNSSHSQRESQDHRDIQNSSVLSNITESSDHSLSLLSDHIVQDETITNEFNETDNFNSVKESENGSAGVLVQNGLSIQNLEPSMAFVESENNLSEIPVETVLAENIDTAIGTVDTYRTEATDDHVDEQTNSIERIEAGILTGLSSSPLSMPSYLETENSLPELPVETVHISVELTEIKSNQDVQPATESMEIGVSEQKESERQTTFPTTEENLPSTSEVFNSTSKTNLSKQISAESISEVGQDEKSKQLTIIEDDLPSTSKGKKPISTSNTTLAKQSSTDSSTAIKQYKESRQPLPTTKTEGSLPSTSTTTKTNSKNTSAEKVSIPKSEQGKSSLSNEDNLPTTSKGTKAKISDARKKSTDETKISGKKPMTASKIPKPKELPKEQPKNQKPKETAMPKTHNEFKKKLPTRSKSFSGPPTPIGIASVKTISQRFINPIQNTAQPIPQKNHATVARKSSITEAINKFTKPSATSEAPSTSALFKSRTQPRIPKKKYHETCFSDDAYETSSSEEEIEPLEIRQRKFSVPVFRAYPSVQEPEEIKTEELVGKFMKEELTANFAQAQIAATLVSMKFPQDVSIWAAKECSDLDHAIALLQQECELCSGTYALNEIISMLKCTHKCCKQCAKTYFTVQITERSINDCNCPFCKLPELNNQTEHEDENLEYFSNLDIFLKTILEPEVHELFQRKLRDRTLLKDPNFKWCVQCSSGFFARPKQKRLICPDCGSVTCAQCRKPWQKQHEGISCDQFLEWEAANDPEIQAKGVKQHLDQYGIDCPKCKFRYSLARGGCMHFTCTQCKYEFCYGCAKPFMMGAKCTISSYCAKLGLHAHHPRNCLFYLRDKLPVQLQILLKNNGVAFEVDPVEAAADVNEPSSSTSKTEARCPIPIQKETPTGLVDTKCNNDVPDKHAGMCRTHYVEYLTAKVAKANIDPLPIFDLTDCVQELRRRGIALPERGPWDTDEIYKKMCSEVIQQNIPLDSD